MTTISSSGNRSRGFTIIELLVTIVAIVLMVTIFPALVDSTTRYTRMSSNDSERASDIAAIVRLLEGYYRKNPDNFITGLSYPPTSKLSAGNISNVIQNEAIRTAPSATTPGISLKTAINNAPLENLSPTNLTPDTYLYQPLTRSGDLCTAVDPAIKCVRYRLAYRTELDRFSTSPIIIESEHQQ